MLHATPSRRLIEVIAFQAVWIATATSAARGIVWPAVISAMLLLGLHLRGNVNRRTTAKALVTAALIGLSTEALLIGTGVLHYATPWPGPIAPPVWLAALWLAFATTLPSTRGVLGARFLPLAIAAGAIFGPLSYYAGEAIGAVTVSSPQGWIAVAAAWGMLYPALLQIDKSLRA